MSSQAAPAPVVTLEAPPVPLGALDAASESPQPTSQVDIEKTAQPKWTQRIDAEYLFRPALSFDVAPSENAYASAEM